MSITSHLEELRSRIIKSLLAVAAGSGVAYFFLDAITKFLTAPVGKLYYMQPGEAFFTYLKIDIVAGFLIALPIIFFHVWKFFLPALTKDERAVLGLLFPDSANRTEIFHGIQHGRFADNVFISKLFRLRDNIPVAVRIRV